MTIQIERFHLGQWISVGMEPISPIDDAINNIGIAGAEGFGVGICPSDVLPVSFTPMTGYDDPSHDNYGNYEFTDGSVCVWIPAFWCRFGSTASPNYVTYGVNAVDVAPLSAYASDVLAAADGFYLHWAFINGGTVQPGWMRSKYVSSLNGAIASSLKNGNALVSSPVAGKQDGFASCTANSQSPAAQVSGAIAAAKSRGNGWHVETVYQAAALWTLSMAHAQASTSTTNCAWYDATNNFPKGNNNNLADVNDVGVSFTGAGVTGYTSLALVGSGSPFNKTTHNGQNCGIPDVNGNYSRLVIGLSTSASSKNIEAITLSNPVSIKVTGHGYSTGMYLRVENIVGTTQLNQKVYRLTVVDSDNFTLDDVDGSGMTAYTSGGSVAGNWFYLLKTSVDVNTITDATSGSYGLWSPTAFASNFDSIDVGFRTDYPNNAFNLKLGNSAERVFAWATDEDRKKTMALLPRSAGVSSGGTALFGNDSKSQQYSGSPFYTFGGASNETSGAGIGSSTLGVGYSSTSKSISFAASFYVV